MNISNVSFKIQNENILNLLNTSVLTSKLNITVITKYTMHTTKARFQLYYNNFNEIYDLFFIGVFDTKYYFVAIDKLQNKIKFLYKFNKVKFGRIKVTLQDNVYYVSQITPKEYSDSNRLIESNYNTPKNIYFRKA